MKDVTLLTISWNQKDATELMLRSYMAEHYKGEPLNLEIFDNGSTDGTRQMLHDYGIDYSFATENLGHESGINAIYNKVKTKYCLLADTDIRFTSSIEPYLEYLKDNCIAVGEQVGELNAAWGTIKPRLGAWMILFDIEKCKEAGINIFRDPAVTDWSYDVGSWWFEKIFQAGFTYHNIQRKTDHFDPIAVYDKFVHYGGISWNLERPDHANRIREITEKRELIKKTLEQYSYIDIKDRFI